MPSSGNTLHKTQLCIQRNIIYELANLHKQYFLLKILQQLKMTVKGVKNKTVEVQGKFFGNIQRHNRMNFALELYFYINLLMKYENGHRKHWQYMLRVIPL
jgi:hypothetical protein